jgi:hypothetical protein
MAAATTPQGQKLPAFLCPPRNIDICRNIRADFRRDLISEDIRKTSSAVLCGRAQEEPRTREGETRDEYMARKEVWRHGCLTLLRELQVETDRLALRAPEVGHVTKRIRDGRPLAEIQQRARTAREARRVSDAANLINSTGSGCWDEEGRHLALSRAAAYLSPADCSAAASACRATRRWLPDAVASLHGAFRPAAATNSIVAGAVRQFRALQSVDVSFFLINRRID